MAAVELYTDEQLLLQMQEGNEQGLELLFKKYYRPLVRFAREILKNTEQAEDLVQELFTRLWHKREEWSISSSLKAYLFTAVRNLCFNQLKQNERKHWMDEGMEDDVRLSVDNTLGQLSAKELEKKINASIEALPPRCRLVFRMSRFEQMSYKEIAGALDLSVKTVENQMGKALATLREAVQPYTKHLYAAVLCLVGSLLAM